MGSGYKSLIPGLVSATFRSKSTAEILKICEKTAIRAIEWSENAHVQTGGGRHTTELAGQTADAGLEVAAYGSYYRLGTPDNIDAFKSSLESAHALGAPIIRVWAGEKASQEISDNEFALIADEAHKIATLAEPAGVKVAFEWHRNTLTDTNKSGISLIKAANHPNIYSLWQPTAALSEDERCDGIRLLGDRLLNLHVYYWPEGKRAALAEGESSWQSYFDCLDTTHNRYALLEFVKDDSEEQFLDDAHTLCNWLKTGC